jgi:hypothetical protein
VTNPLRVGSTSVRYQTTRDAGSTPPCEPRSKITLLGRRSIPWCDTWLDKAGIRGMAFPAMCALFAEEPLVLQGRVMPPVPILL